MRVQANTAETKRLLIATGRFAGFLPQSYAHNQIRGRRLRALRPATLSITNTVVAFILRDGPKSLACEHFEQALRAAFRQDRGGV
jgi:DNA-binding transcriptional LysR family regulator